MATLLDVNVLIALLDPDHVHYKAANAWLSAQGAQKFATCPLTQNGLVRITGNLRYATDIGSTQKAAESLASIVADSRHVFWPDAISLLDSAYIDVSKLGTHATITDTYLLALAVHNKGKLATFDRRILTSAVIGGAAHVELIGPISQTQS